MRGGGTPILVAAAPPTSSCRSSLCGLFILGIVLLALWYWWNPSRPPVRERDIIIDKPIYGSAATNSELSGDTNPAARPFNSPHGDVLQSAAKVGTDTGCVNPQATSPVLPTSGVLQDPSQTAGSLADRPVVSAAMAGGSVGGAPLDSSTYGMTEDGAEYMKHFQPVSLESTMPMGWRASTNPQKCAAGGDEVFTEFSRYAITPNQMKRAENMRSVLRLGENTRDGLSRTLGQRSLLRDFVTPLGPSPIGDNAMLWNDSSVRQGYIASATGRFPTVNDSC